MKTIRLKALLTTLAAALLLAALPADASRTGVCSWSQISDGLHYTTFHFSPGPDEPSTAMHAFRIDPKKFRIDVVTAKNEQTGSTASEMARREKASLVINGGFFTPAHTSIGLIVKDGRELSPIHKTSWWSIFSMVEDRPAIHSPRDFDSKGGVRMALQVGPRLAVNGRILKLKESVAARSAVGITRSQEVVIAITQGPGISMTELARRMSKPNSDGGLGCPDAMALDGGSSSQIFARFGKFELSIPNLARVTNGLAVFPK